MPIGSIPWSQRLGIANPTERNASALAQTVLRLAATVPIYQQQLVHQNADYMGPNMDAAWCGTPDNDAGQTCTIREISAHYTQFARRNLSSKPPSPAFYPFSKHKTDFTNQIYYVGNEPEAGSKVQDGYSCSSKCWNPRNRDIDPDFLSFFPNPDTSFWQDASYVGLSVGDECVSSNPQYKCIKPDALATVFLQLKRGTTTGGHVVLPPAALDPELGADLLPEEVGNKAIEFKRNYWRQFFQYVHDYHYGNLAISDLKALHLHAYADKIEAGVTPLSRAAFDVTRIRRGVDWYKGIYSPSAALPLDILISETGPWLPYYDPAQGDLRYSGGFSSLKLGLNWWNTYLCWLTRPGPYECHLEGWDTGAHTIHACVQHPTSEGVLTTHRAPAPSLNARYFNADTWSQGLNYNAPYIHLPGLNMDGEYLNLFTAYGYSLNYNNKTWYTTPFGACYTVWSQVGPLPASGNINTGWISNTQSGLICTANITLPVGYSTVYFPVVKGGMGTFPQTTITCRWRDGSRLCDQGSMNLSSLQDTTAYNIHGYNQTVYSAMVFPVVCYSSRLRTVTLDLYRSASGPSVTLGKPVVLPGSCSWILHQ